MMTLMRRAAMVASAVLLVAGPMQTSLAQLPAIEDNGKPTIAPLIRQVTPAVVNIAVVGTTRVARNPLLDDPFFRRFFDLPDQSEQTIPQQSAGSGVIVDARNGYVLTNHHVVENADEITVNLADRRQLVGSDAGTDVLREGDRLFIVVQ